MNTASPRFNLSFNIPVDPPPQFIFVGPEETKAGCPGVSEAGLPDADPGKLCVYASFGFNIDIFSAQVSPAGAFVITKNKEAEETIFSGQGVWAVTAAEE